MSVKPEITFDVLIEIPKGSRNKYEPSNIVRIIVVRRPGPPNSLIMHRKRWVVLQREAMHHSRERLQFVVLLRLGLSFRF